MRDRLGVEVPPGGRHDRTGTHNHVMCLGGDEFLEIIAIDPAASKPAHPRPFALDTFADDRVCLGTWVARTPDLAMALDQLPGSCGRTIPLSRGELSWLLAVPDDGSMPFDGAFPTLIEWPMRPFPGARMPDLGCVLEQLVIEHPNAANHQRPASWAF